MSQAEDHQGAQPRTGQGPLAGVRVIDVTTVFMGPSATQMLGDLGADVIKVEAPGGDATRKLGPNGENDLGAIFLGLNRNKRSIVLDLKTEAGVEALLKLAADADVLAYNVRPAAMKRLGLGYERLAAINPRIIYAGMIGFSQRGRNAAMAAFDDLIQSACALPVAMAGGNEGVPRYLPITIADRSVGIYATTCPAKPSCRRAAASAIRGSCRPTGGRTAPRTATSAASSTPTGTGRPS